MTKRYRLLKDYPGAEAGDIYELDRLWLDNKSRIAITVELGWLKTHSDYFEEIKEEQPFQWNDKLVEELVWENFGAADTRYRVEQFKKEKEASKTNSIKEEPENKNDFIKGVQWWVNSDPTYFRYKFITNSGIEFTFDSVKLLQILSAHVSGGWLNKNSQQNDKRTNI